MAALGVANRSMLGLGASGMCRCRRTSRRAGLNCWRQSAADRGPGNPYLAMDLRLVDEGVNHAA